MDAYQQVAQRLLDMHRSDQEWLINQLSPRDREQVAAALAALRVGSDGRLVSVTSTESEAEKPIESSPSAIDIVRGWEASTIAALLADEPIWLAALVLSSLDLEQVENVLANMDRRRVEAVRTAYEQMAQSTHAHIVDLISRNLIEKAEHRRMTPRSTGFESTLRRAVCESQHLGDHTI